jgi:DNA-binding NarL/FixJ family response regulator
MHGAPLEGTDQLALIIEPANAGDVAPLIVEAYGLTQRELDVTRAIARGLGTAEIAAHVHLSAHTVRDYIKAVFEKVGVSSRGELVHKVFAEHYAPAPH